MTDRPAEFDARLLSYKRLLWMFAKRHKKTLEEQEVLVQDTFMRALDRWRNFREEGSFTNWLYYIMLNVVSAERYGGNPIFVSEDRLDGIATQPNQEAYAELSMALRHMENSEPLKRLAAGDTQSEIAKDWGVSRSAVSQMIIRHREKYLGVPPETA